MIDASFECYDSVAAAVFVLEIGKDGTPRYVWMNHCAEVVSGRLRSDVGGLTGAELFGGQAGHDAFDHACEATQNGGEVSYLADIAVNGQLRSFRTTLVPSKDLHGKTTRIVGTLVEQNHPQTSPHLSPACRTHASEVEQFVAMAAHDLRTPMRNVQILAEMIREDLDGNRDGIPELLNLLDDVARKSKELICNVLDHVQTISATPERLPFDLGRLCRITSDMLDPTRQHRFTCTTAIVQADKTAIQITLRNLIDNAIKHCGRAEVTVDVHARALGDGMIEIDVCDNGQGFSDIDRVFSDKTEFRGASGYGLLGIQRLIAARGGRIVVEQLDGTSGSCVRFTLPGTLALVNLTRAQTATAGPSVPLVRQSTKVS